MKDYHAIYSATYDNTAYRALTTQIDALAKPSHAEKTDAILYIQNLALRLSDPFYTTQMDNGDPVLFKWTGLLKSFAYENGLPQSFIKELRRYLNRFRAAALAEAMTVQFTGNYF